MVAIIDYNMGNLHSVKKAFDRIGAESIISNNPRVIQQAGKLVLPGVGHFQHGMRQLKELDLIDLLKEEVLNKGKFILGICLGMQLFTEYSKEGSTNGLGWISAKTHRFDKSYMKSNMKIPHMGWNNLEIKNDSELFSGITSENMFYFVHTYYVKNDTKEEVKAVTNYGNEFSSVFQKENIFGVQFHPEKSHDSGLLLLKNFIELK